MIFYFSGTGNTKWAARVLAGKTNEEQVFIPDVAGKPYHIRLKPGERLGFCFPVHGWRPPTLVRKFIESMAVENCGEYVYALVTAGDTIGETIDILNGYLAKKGMSLNAACSLIMPESYVGLPFMDVDTKEKEREKISKAKEKLDWFANVVGERKCGVEDLMKGNWPKVNSRLIGGFFHRFLVTDGPFRVEADRCIKCGKCAMVCSVHNIIWTKGNVPQWRHEDKCMACFSCYHHCPTHAIEYGGRTKRKGQYFFDEDSCRQP